MVAAAGAALDDRLARLSKSSANVGHGKRAKQYLYRTLADERKTRYVNYDPNDHLSNRLIFCMILPHLRSLQGLAMLRRHVKNWVAVLMVYLNLKRAVVVRFRDHTTLALSKRQFTQFYEKLYRMHLQANGFTFSVDEQGRSIVKTPHGDHLIVPDGYSIAFDEVYLMQVYGRPDLVDKTVVDVGASVGDTAIYFSHLGPRHVYAFEVDPQRCEMARENFILNQLDDRCTLIDHAATAGEINSLNPDFIKIDCEGCEHELLERLDLRKVSGVAMEYHGAPDRLIEILGNAGLRTEKRKEIIIASRGIMRESISPG